MQWQYPYMFGCINILVSISNASRNPLMAAYA
jgi:hypothetical protein